MTGVFFKMKISALQILVFLMLGALNCDAQKEYMSRLIAEKESIKISLSTPTETWTRNKMLVTVGVANNLPADTNLKIGSIRFHLMPEEGGAWQTFIVSEGFTLPVKKGEKAQLNYDLSKFPSLFASSSEKGARKLAELKNGKFKVALLLQTAEKNYESSIFIDFSEAKTESAGELTEAGKKLNEATIFAVGQTEKGYVSLQEIALREILVEKYAESSFKYIIRNGTPEGKLYALLGLKLIRCDCFAEQLEGVKKFVKFRDENAAETGIAAPETAPAGKVRFQSGCEVGLEDFSEIVRQIAEGKFDRILEDKVDKEGRIVR